MQLNTNTCLLLICTLFLMKIGHGQSKLEKPIFADPENAVEIEDSIVGPRNITGGYGLVRDFSAAQHEDYSIWFKFYVDHDTTLTLDIVPVNPSQDYDFILFKCTSKETLDSIRSGKRIPERICYSQNFAKNSSTGLSVYATSKIVGAGPGSAYVPALKVKAGEMYYLMVEYGEEYMHRNAANAPDGFMIYFYDYWPKKKPVVLKSVLFETNKSVLKQSSFPELDKLVLMLKQNQLINIEISGHTDNTGNQKTNLRLSEDRAHAVVDYIASKGIDKNRLFYKGLGSERPISSNTTKEGREKNRRVEFAIIMK